MFTLGFIKISEELAHGGMADNMPDSAFNESSVDKGMKVEKEHTKNKKLQKEIAKDHLKEDPKYYRKLAKMEKKAFSVNPMAAGALGGLAGGYSAGRGLAENTAGHLSSHGHKTRNEQTAKNIAMISAPVGALAGLALMSKHKEKILPMLRKRLGNSSDMNTVYEAALPALAGIGGGAAAGAGTGALMSLRGKFKKDKLEKKAGLFDKAKPSEPVSKLSALGKHLHKYRRDYLMGAGTTAAVSSAVSMKKREKIK